MVILVTGHRGFLGSRILDHLAAEGWHVVGAGRPEVEIPSPAFDALLEATGPDVVVHAAGPASVGASLADPDADRRGSVGVLEGLIEQLGHTPLVLVSSAAVYGDAASLPIGEAAPLRPISPYGRHRLECEEILSRRASRGAVLRVFSAYGEGLRRQVLWDICRRAQAGPVELSGTGAESRDFVHVSDVAEAVATVVRQQAFGGKTFNVASGGETTVARLAALLVEGLGLRREISFSGARREGDPGRWRADIERICRLGFRPRVSIEDGAARYAAWFSRQR